MPYRVKISSPRGKAGAPKKNSLLTLPARWIRWLAENGYSTESVDLEFPDDGRLVLCPFKPAPEVPAPRQPLPAIVFSPLFKPGDQS